MEESRDKTRLLKSLEAHARPLRVRKVPLRNIQTFSSETSLLNHFGLSYFLNSLPLYPMKTLLTTVFSALSLLPLSAAAVPYHSVHYFDQIIRVTPRVINRSIEPDVRRVHTPIDHATGLPTGFFKRSYQKNMCVLELRHCSRAQESNGLNVQDCHQFSPILDCGGLR